METTIKYAPNRYRCKFCDEKTTGSDILIADHPFKDDSLIYGCPCCQEIDTLIRVCDADDCWREVYDLYEGVGNIRYIGACATHAMNIKKLKESAAIIGGGSKQ